MTGTPEGARSLHRAAWVEGDYVSVPRVTSISITEIIQRVLDAESSGDL
ncbi:hypothetical protein [Nocardioides hwasunensis]|uniref:Uncharacterized protein n=1 Tax=Nocardioides hwasunensis TaxID=397258 RepID=A0ABR8MFF3_9ACTN|nr:hypothetical protein [Nocardioides hwasunensis]MBD3914305.1 hypothetical protein [Nocardioides hwasunensis]